MSRLQVSGLPAPIRISAQTPLWTVLAEMSRADTRFETIGLAHARSRRDAESALQGRLDAQGYHTITTSARPVAEAAWDIALSRRGDLDDGLWLAPPAFADARAPAVSAALPGDFRPRSVAVTGWPSRRIEGDETAAPTPLHPLLFTPQDRTYAVIDANRFFGLPERLEGSGLRHCCLFRGKAERDYAAYAPFLVELLPRHAFTRLLFTQSTRPGGANHWADQAAIFVTSPLGLDALSAHFRLFTMIIDKQANMRMYFRFYAPEVMRTVIATMQPAQLQDFGRGIRRFICHDGGTGALVLER